jgi:hypothetical protein
MAFIQQNLALPQQFLNGGSSPTILPSLAAEEPVIPETKVVTG